VTLRALDVLAAVDVVAAEDTRRTRRLLDRHGIRTRLVSYHAQSAASRTAALLEHLRAGRDIALVTDAGTPGISDPGAGLVTAWAAEGGRVVPVPGPSAVIAAVAASGVAGARWSFDGFLPRSGSERRKWLGWIAADERGTVLFEAPSRVAATLLDLIRACGPERPGAVCRELTKLHEQIERGTLAELRQAVENGVIPLRGEFVIVVGAVAGDGHGVAEPASGASVGGPAAPPPASVPLVGDPLGAARAEVERLVAGGVARGEAARRVAAATGLPRRQLYGARKS
jgi:16S rRNA (cytidine1402-2'-O)-methyltransferase